jgi:hypothetical protein
MTLIFWGMNLLLFFEFKKRKLQNVFFSKQYPYNCHQREEGPNNNQNPQGDLTLTERESGKHTSKKHHNNI